MKKPIDSYTESSTLAMPEHANTIGTIFGGHLLNLMDETSAICARRHSEARVTTVSVESVTFFKPIQVGHVITVTAILCRTFTTSMDVQVEVWASNTYNGDKFLAAKAYFIIVGMTKDHKPCKLPELHAETPEELKRWDQAGARRKARKERRENN